MKNAEKVGFYKKMKNAKKISLSIISIKNNNSFLYIEKIFIKIIYKNYIKNINKKYHQYYI